MLRAYSLCRCSHDAFVIQARIESQSNFMVYHGLMLNIRFQIWRHACREEKKAVSNHSESTASYFFETNMIHLLSETCTYIVYFDNLLIQNLYKYITSYPKKSEKLLQDKRNQLIYNNTTSFPFSVYYTAVLFFHFLPSIFYSCESLNTG